MIVRSLSPLFSSCFERGFPQEAHVPGATSQAYSRAHQSRESRKQFYRIKQWTHLKLRINSCATFALIYPLAQGMLATPWAKAGWDASRQDAGPVEPGWNRLELVGIRFQVRCGPGGPGRQRSKLSLFCSRNLWSNAYIRCCTGHIPNPKIVLYKDSAALISEQWEVSPLGLCWSVLNFFSANPLLTDCMLFVLVAAPLATCSSISCLHYIGVTRCVCSVSGFFPFVRRFCFLAFAQKSPTDSFGVSPLRAKGWGRYTLDKKLNLIDHHRDQMGDKSHTCIKQTDDIYTHTFFKCI